MVCNKSLLPARSDSSGLSGCLKLDHGLFMFGSSGDMLENQGHLLRHLFMTHDAAVYLRNLAGKHSPLHGCQVVHLGLRASSCWDPGLAASRVCLLFYWSLQRHAANIAL